MNHLVSLDDWSAERVGALLDLAGELKARHARGIHEDVLTGKVLGMIFEKASTRTRFSFEAAMVHLGGASVFVETHGKALDAREPIEDLARVYSGYCDALVLRTYAHETVRKMAEHAAIPVINGLSDHRHPCQALADLLTIREVAGTLDGLAIAWVGDANNVAASLALGCARTGARLRAASPPGYTFPDAFRSSLEGTLDLFDTPEEAVDGAAAVYTDVWISMGQEEEAQARRSAFAAYQVTPALMEHAAPEAVFLHCLPAHRGEEVHAEVIEGPRSAVYRQAENRMHLQKALLWALLNPGDAAPGWSAP